jgi:predicted transposase/invertase (TIGR01784 family)
MPYVTSWERMTKEEGVEIGVKIGEESGVKIGVEKGDKHARREVAKQMILENFPMATIAKLTGLPLNELTDLAASLSPKDH